MEWFIARAWKQAIAGLLGLGVASSASAQTPGFPNAPPPLAPAPGAPVGGPIGPGDVFPVRAQAAPQTPPPMPKVGPDPLLSSRPAPFQVAPSTPAAGDTEKPAATNDQNFFSGNKPV